MKAQFLIPLVFEDFLCKENLLRIQDSFIANDITKLILFEYDIGLDFNLEIDISFQNPNQNFPNKWKLISVLEDSLAHLSKEYIKKYNSDIENKELFTVTKKLEFTEHKLEMLPNIEKALQNLDYDLPSSLKNTLLIQYNKYHDFLVDKIASWQLMENEKIKFNINRNDLLVLFILLREASIIDNYTDSELGKLIDCLFLYKSKKGYSRFKNSRKIINDIKNGNRAANQSILRLKEILQKEELYQIV